MARKKNTRGRDINGVILLDKPSGITSNDALQQVKRLMYAKKAGHTGSLDPLATGMLPICFGEATKFSRFLLEADKRYLVKAKLGVSTTTGDSEGKVVAEKSAESVTQADLETALNQFHGPIKQIPSMYSALKHHGVPLYEYAREGKEIEREPRDVTIFELNLLGFHAGDVELFVHCSKGTYVRTLVQDIGDALGVGAHVFALRRLTVAHYENQMVSLTELEAQKRAEDFEAMDAKILSIESIVASMPMLDVSQAAAFYLKQGQPVILPHAPSEGMVRLCLQGVDFLGVGEILPDGRVAPKRIVRVYPVN